MERPYYTLKMPTCYYIQDPRSYYIEHKDRKD